MNLATEVFNDVIVVHAPGELGFEQSEAFEKFIDSLERKRLVLDLDTTEAIDSKGLTCLLDLHDRLRAAGGDIRISTTNPVNRKILEITRLDQQLEVFDSVVEAVKSFRAQ